MSKHYEKFNALQQKFMELADSDCEVETTYQELANVSGILNLSSVRNYVTKMLNDGFLTIVVEPKRGTKGTTYRVNCDKHNKLTEVDESEFVHIPFGGLDMALKRTTLGLCISVEDLGVATLTDGRVIEQIIEANREVFEPNMISENGNVYLSRTAVLNYLMKLNLNRIIEAKRAVLKDFNNQILNLMVESIATGKVILKDHERVEIRINIAQLVDLEHAQIEELFHKIEDEFNGILAGFSGELKTTKQSVHQVEKKLNRTSSLLDSEKRKKELCMSEIQELKGKLMERNVN